jgi:hypothetical protein
MELDRSAELDILTTLDCTLELPRSAISKLLMQDMQYPLKTAGREKTKIRGKSLFGNRLPRSHGNLLGQGMIPPIQIEGYRI